MEILPDLLPHDEIHNLAAMIERLNSLAGPSVGSESGMMLEELE